MSGLRKSDLAALLVLALAVRVGFVLLVDGPGAWPGDDNTHYFDAAVDLLEGRGLPLRWSPLLPALEAGLFAVVGPSTLAARLLTSVLGALAAPLAALLAARWMGRAGGLLAGLLVSCDGYLVASSARALSEAPFIALLLAALVAFPAPRLTGLLLGLACLARPTGAAYVIAAAVALSLAAPAGRRRFASVAALLLTAGACLLPLTLRSSAVAERFVLTTIGAGSTLLGANCEEALTRRESWIPALECGVLTPAEVAVVTGDPAAGDRVLARAAVRDLASDPGRWPRLLLRKLASFWGWGNEGWSGSAVNRLSLAIFTLLLPLAAAGAVVTVSRRQDAALAALLFLGATLALALVFWGGHRMRLPAQPILLAWSAVGLVEAHRKLRPSAATASRLAP